MYRAAMPVTVFAGLHLIEAGVITNCLVHAVSLVARAARMFNALSAFFENTVYAAALGGNGFSGQDVVLMPILRKTRHRKPQPSPLRRQS
jgi:hypothetical protein